MNCGKCGEENRVVHTLENEGTELHSTCSACGYSTQKPTVPIQRLPFEGGKNCPQCGEPFVSVVFVEGEAGPYLVRGSHCGFKWETECAS